jgi:hypothetical protein
VESENDYLAYKRRAVFFNASASTVEGLSGLVMRIDPITDLPQGHDYLLEDADLQGTSLFEFASHQVDEVLTVARSGLLVDYPRKDSAVMTKAQAEAAGLRPYLASYATEDILNWKRERRNGRMMLTQVRLRESYSTTVDEFTEEKGTQVRVLDLDDAGNYRQRVFRKKNENWEQDGEDIYPLRQNQPLPFIPFYIIGPARNTATVAKPPILDLVNVNLGHYVLTADYYNGLHFTGCPTPVITGHKVPENEVIAIGSEAFLVLSSSTAKAYFMEFGGQGLGQLEKELQALEQRMAVLGARMLQDEKRGGVEAAETAAIHRSGEASVLAALAGSCSKGIKRAMNAAVWWAGGPQDAVGFDLNRDFMPSSMSPQMLAQLLAAFQGGGISHQVFFEALQRGEVIRNDLTLEDMQDQIASDSPQGGFTDDDTGGGGPAK